MHDIQAFGLQDSQDPSGFKVEAQTAGIIFLQPFMLVPRTFQGEKSRLYAIGPQAELTPCLWSALGDLKLAERGFCPT